MAYAPGIFVLFCFFLAHFLHIFVWRMNERLCVLGKMSDYRSREGQEG